MNRGEWVAADAGLLSATDAEDTLGAADICSRESIVGGEWMESQWRVESRSAWLGRYALAGAMYACFVVDSSHERGAEAQAIVHACVFAQRK